MNSMMLNPGYYIFFYLIDAVATYLYNQCVISGSSIPKKHVM